MNVYNLKTEIKGETLCLFLKLYMPIQIRLPYYCFY